MRRLLELSGWWWGVALIVGVNIIVLAGVKYNRSAEPVGRVTLTERELAMPSYWYQTRQEDTGIALRIVMYAGNWNWFDYASGGYDDNQPHWIDQAKLAELGFDVSKPLDSKEGRRYYRKQLPREVYLALEYDGPLHAASVDQARQRLALEKKKLTATPTDKQQHNRVETAAKSLQWQMDSASRLYAFDAGADLATLMQRHHTKTNVVYARGRITMQLHENKNDARKIWLSGYLRGLSIQEVHIPKPYREVLNPFRECKPNSDCLHAKPRYSVTLAYGQRLEPWVIDVQPLKLQ